MAIFIYDVKKEKRDELVRYPNLKANPKAYAREQVINHEYRAFILALFHYTDSMKKNIHEYISDRTKFKALVRQLKLVKRMHNDQDFLEKIIVGNLSNFTISGEYVVYSRSPVKTPSYISMRYGLKNLNLNEYKPYKA